MKVKLGDISQIITGPFGSQLHMSDYVSDGYPVIMPQNISNRRVNEIGIARIDDSNFNRLIRYSVQPNDIIYARRGKVDEHAFIDVSKKMICGTGCFRVRVVSREVYPLFLSLYLNRSETRQWLISHAVGSNMPNLNTDILSNVPLELPEYSEQVRIAQCLQSIDDKINCNNAINDNLQQVIKSCFDFMFATRKPNGIISDILQEHPKSTIQVNDSTGILGDYPFFTSGEAINEWQSALVDGMNCYLSTGGNATIKGYYGKAAYSTDTWCVCGKGEYSFYLFCYLKSIIRSINDSFFAGSGLKHLQKDSLLLVNLYIPSEKELEKFNSIVKPAMETMTKLFLETKKLKQQRDFLLPLLMNGQATIAE